MALAAIHLVGYSHFCFLKPAEPVLVFGRMPDWQSYHGRPVLSSLQRDLSTVSFSFLFLYRVKTVEHKIQFHTEFLAYMFFFTV